MMNKRHVLYVCGALCAVFFFWFFTISPNVVERFVASVFVSQIFERDGSEEPIVAKPARVIHLETPNAVRAIYMTQCAVGTPSLRESLVALVETTELNSIIIDIRDYTGTLSFTTENPLLVDMVSDKCGASDMKEFIKELHDRGVYVIGRITVFQNPYYTNRYPEQAVQKKDGGVWKDYKGLAYVDVNSRLYWDSVVELSKESYGIGFDELNFDYIRYPSDGPMSQAVYRLESGEEKQEVLEEFFKYLHDKLKPLRSTSSGQAGVVTSVDVFGMTTTNTDDLNIGQVLERALPYFDYISPMVYPSHYPKGFRGYMNVNEHSYDIVLFSMQEAVRRALATTTPVYAFPHTRAGTTTPALYVKPVYASSKLRPWLQSFNYPVPYTPLMVAAQIKANEDAGLDSYMFWDPANKYISLREVLQSTKP